MSDWILASDALVGTSPMELPGRCVECGRDASGGRRVNTTLYWYPRWIWVGVLWGVFPVILLYYAARRPLKISYSLCPKDDWSLRMRRRVAMGVGALLAVFLIAAVATHFNRFFMIAAIVLFIAALIVHFMAQVPLRAAGHDDGVFGIRGFSKGFLSTVKGPDSAVVPDS